MTRRSEAERQARAGEHAANLARWTKPRRTGPARVRTRQPHPAHIQRINPEHPPVMHVHENGKVHQGGTPLAVNCPVCRPPGKKWDRSKAGKAV